ncbi:hypothetical protein ACKLNO_04555 [Neisseriaceae bacterium B1]
MLCLALFVAACGGKEETPKKVESTQASPGEQVLQTRQKAGAAAQGVQDKLNQQSQ